MLTHLYIVVQASLPVFLQSPSFFYVIKWQNIYNNEFLHSLLPLNFTASVYSIVHNPQIHLRIPSSPITYARFTYECT